MPALSPWDSLAARSQINSTASNAVNVVCAWPVSGQYGPGSRVLYYVLVAACVLARKTVWLRKASLAAALLLPAVASLHALVLCSMHINGAVDMDIYGAFQLCSIGILTAPLTVRLSRTYFYDPGRNLIFLWTGVILAGLLALAVEFYRVTPIPCQLDDFKGDPKSFPYGLVDCGLTCSTDKGPFSPLRAGPAKDVGVIPVPDILTFNAGMLLAAACCLPAILSLMFTWDKILDIHWKRNRPNEQAEDERENELIEGTNGATVGQMKGINGMVRRVLSVVEIPLFGGAVLALLIVGEINFFSAQVDWLTEPIASVGQWGPIAGTALAVLGSLYLLLTKNPDNKKSNGSDPFCPHCNGSNQIQRQPTLNVQSAVEYSPSNRSMDAERTEMYQRPSHESGVTTIHEASDQRMPSPPADPGGRRKVAQMLKKAGDYLGSAAHNKYDMSAYNRSRAREFPEIPGEAQRNPELSELKRQYSRRRDVVLREEHSRGTSPVASPPASPVASASSVTGLGIEVTPSPPPDASPNAESSRGRLPRRRATLEVPPVAYHRPST